MWQFPTARDLFFFFLQSRAPRHDSLNWQGSLQPCNRNSYDSLSWRASLACDRPRQSVTVTRRTSTHFRLHCRLHYIHKPPHLCYSLPTASALRTGANESSSQSRPLAVSMSPSGSPSTSDSCEACRRALARCVLDQDISCVSCKASGADCSLNKSPQPRKRKLAEDSNIIYGDARSSQESMGQTR